MRVRIDKVLIPIWRCKWHAHLKIDESTNEALCQIIMVGCNLLAAQEGGQGGCDPRR